MSALWAVRQAATPPAARHTKAKEPELDSNEVRVLVALLMFCDEKGSCYPSIPRIGKMMGMSRETVVKTLRKLEQYAGPLELSIKRNVDESHEYRLRWNSQPRRTLHVVEGAPQSQEGVPPSKTTAPTPQSQEGGGPPVRRGGTPQ